MYRNKNFEQNKQNLKTENQSTKLAIIASAVTTFGDALSTLAAILELEEEQQEQRDQEDFKKMQKQIEFLTTEIEKLKNK